jgi:hypothetical protein
MSVPLFLLLLTVRPLLDAILCVHKGSLLRQEQRARDCPSLRARAFGVTLVTNAAGGGGNGTHRWG